MDILIIADFISKFSNENEAQLATNYISSFIKERSEFYDYYCIFLNSIGREENLEDGFDAAILDTPEGHYFPIFEEILFNPIPNVSLCFRNSKNPFVFSNPPLNTIFEAIKLVLNKSESQIDNIYVLHSSGCLDLESLEKAFRVYANVETISVLSLDKDTEG